MRRWVLSLAMVAGCLMLPSVAEAGTTGTADVQPSSSYGAHDATGLIVSTDGLLPEAVLRRISLLLGRDVVGQTPMGGSAVALRLDHTLPASSVRLLSKLLNLLPGVAHVSPDLVATSDSVPNDSYFPQQTNLWTPVPVSSDSGGEDPPVGPDFSMDAPTMWDATRGSKSVVVALVDGGLVAHPDLAKQAVPGYDLIADPRNSKDGDGRDPNAADPGNASNGRYCAAHPSTWHGTHVAGIVAALRNNGIGISGIAPGVAIQPVRVVGQCGATMSDIIAGIRWASGGDVPGVPRNKTPADVINVSLSSSVTDLKCPAAYQDVIDEARSRGAIVVVSAGNQSESLLNRTPANCQGVLSVGATDIDGSLTSYTNAGRTIGIMAQGGEVGPNEGIWSTVDAGTAGPVRPTYGQNSGTSMAAPAVSAAAALVLSLGHFTNDQVVQVLKAAALKPPEFDSYYTCISHDPTTGVERNVCGAGILNLASIPAPVGHPVLQGGSTVGSTLSFTPGRWNGHPDSVTYQWLRDGTPIAGATTTSYVLAGADLGRTLTVRSTAHTQGYPDFSGLSAAKAVPKATASVTLRLSATRARVNTTRLYAYVTVTAAQGQSPTGSVEAYVDGRRVALVALSSGRAQVRLPVFSTTGSHKVQMRYGGNSRVSYKWSPSVWVSVSK
ncbi:S8 family serine peptidase [Aeromicrobium ginsengisoli]|uniref:S8 family serine peptidase n=1 Tax=Aeromicrobium ginsengisoli TaxID=363867 RepID=A0A5M4FF17_9ACTN|nr:S8 family serine peptidase [Aeromicrobium ginsengisoli]KAA1397947.1 S8 family serine peptidase [Aeromicrobium ginsengisoli]